MKHIEFNLAAVMSDIAAHYKHACDKHPYFADTIISANDPETRDSTLDGVREKMRNLAAMNDLDAKTVLECETEEIWHAVAHGNTAQAREECFDAIAVLIRIVDVLDGLQKLGKGGAE